MFPVTALEMLLSCADRKRKPQEQCDTSLRKNMSLVFLFLQHPEIDRFQVFATANNCFFAVVLNGRLSAHAVQDLVR